jgi:hypothetical protein
MSEEWATREMSGAALRDGRRRKSVGRICARLADQPGVSFSAACGPAVRQAAHRLFAHPQTTVDKLLAGHYQQTARRCQAQALVLAVQDTTTFEYSGLKATVGLGPLNDQLNARGLFAHSTLALAPDGTPLGLLGVHFWRRPPAEHGKTRARRRRLPHEKESQKWRRGLEAVERVLPADQPVLVIQDREGDVFDFLAAPRRPTTHLLVRASQPRVVKLPAPTDPSAGEPPSPAGDGGRGTLFEVAGAAPLVTTMTVRVGRKTGQPEREVELAVRATLVWVQPPARKGVVQVPQPLWVVVARETEPHPGAPALEWVLLTTMPLPDAAATGQLVRYYALRWTIERFHYTVKSGCQVERLQLDDATALQHALALYLVVGWRLLYLTYLARTAAETPASDCLTPEEITVLSQAHGQPVTTIQTAIRVLARLGGQETYRTAPTPGVKRLWLGLRRLEAMVEGWQLAQAMFNARHLEL